MLKNAAAPTFENTVAAFDRIKEGKPASLTFVCLLDSPHTA